MRSVRSTLALLLGTLPAQAEAPTPSMAVELNTVEQAGTECRLTFTIRNGGDADIDAVTIETVLFDATGGVADFALFDFGEVPAGRMRVRRFTLAETACESLSGFLLNGVATCTAAGAESRVCARPQATSRTDIEALE